MFFVCKLGHNDGNSFRNLQVNSDVFVNMMKVSYFTRSEACPSDSSAKKIGRGCFHLK